ncbi:hypothetical protein Dsin_015897 [Dipteronia sinensis]|uniref:DUF4283 domain-containing protein n=1 Tax=Dipteronia sinensis TaxID=43782 RepID=A0AAE0E4Z8_9ROSI|nr:hypothetical protein Dsin_015897 [Dipteronia sinensis]
MCSHEEIAKLCESMNLLEKGGLVQRLHEGLKTSGMWRLALSLVGKVLTYKMVKEDVFMGVLAKIWRVKEGVEIESVAQNIFTFQFKNIEDMQQILAGGPWTFDGALIVFGETIR